MRIVRATIVWMVAALMVALAPAFQAAARDKPTRLGERADDAADHAPASRQPECDGLAALSLVPYEPLPRAQYQFQTSQGRLNCSTVRPSRRSRRLTSALQLRARPHCRLAKIGSAKLVLPPDQSVQAALREGWPII
jgi:hypothetical protein